MDSHADSPLLFAPGGTLFLALPLPAGRGPSRPRPYTVKATRDNNGRLLVFLEGVADRNAAEALRGAEVLVSEADLPPPDEGEVYLHKLLGARVFMPDGSDLGEFTAILDTPGQLTFVITAKGGAEILFPAVPEFILGLDAEAGEIHIDPPPGLIELYATLTTDALQAQRHPLPREFIQTRFRRVRADLAERIRAGQAAGLIDPDIDPDDAAALVAAASDGLQLQWLLHPEEVDIRRSLALLERVLPAKPAGR